MRRLALAIATAACLGACGSNPLLQVASSNLAPIQVNSTWSYRSPDGLSTESVLVTAQGEWQGRPSYLLSASLNGGAAAQFAMAESQGAWSVWAAGMAPGQWQWAQASSNPPVGAPAQWILLRQTPLVPGDSWNVPTTAQNLSQTATVVDLETVKVPAGTFTGCAKVQTLQNDFSSGASVVTSTLVWCAPNVGDVQYASEDVNGVVTVNLQLVSYHIP